MKRLLFIILLLASTNIVAEPWIDTRDAWLRADIEYLSDIGVITVPVTTWPLMWAPIIKDLNNAELDNLSDAELRVYKRVKRKGKYETKLESHSYLSLKAGNQGKILRHFGDDRREKAEITTKNTGMTKNFAWNIEATRAFDPIDGEENRLDNSYVAAIWGNWIFSAGAQERWWGPGWDSSLILSNNARPVPGISLQRNYSDPFESKWLSWIGPWTFNAFAGQLESDRHIPHAKLLGMSVNFKPLDSLEIGLRRTAQWGGYGRPQSLSSLLDLAIGNSNCDEVGLGCVDRSQEPGNQLAGIDFKWRIPTSSYFGSIYGQLIGEDEAGYLPSRKIKQLGFSTKVALGLIKGAFFLEFSDTLNDIGPDTTYNHGLYLDGYRFNGRSIGSTYDNDTEIISIGLTARLNDNSGIRLGLSSVNINEDGSGGHNSLSLSGVKVNRFTVHYSIPTKYALFEAKILLQDKRLDSFNKGNDKWAASFSWTYEI